MFLLHKTDTSLVPVIYRILLPELSTTGDLCVEFQYHMYGFHMGSLAVFHGEGEEIEKTPNMWSWVSAKDQGDKWLAGSVSIPNYQATDNVRN